MVGLYFRRVESHTTLGTASSSGGLGLHSRLDLGSHCQKGLLNVLRRLGRCFEEFDSKRVSEFFALLCADDSLRREITLVTNKELVHILSSVSIDLVQPLLHIVERLHISYIIDNDDTMSSAVVARSNGAETFLPSGIPNLEFDSLLVQLNGTDFLVEEG